MDHRKEWTLVDNAQGRVKATVAELNAAKEERTR